MLNIVLFGPPGAGKGTQANFLKSTFNLVHISTGDVFRKNIKNQTPLGILAQSYIDRGALVPDQVTIDMLSDEVYKNTTGKGFIFDGFPRNIVQAEALDSVLSKHSAQVDAMIALEVEDEILVSYLIATGANGASNWTTLRIRNLYPGGSTNFGGSSTFYNGTTLINRSDGWAYTTSSGFHIWSRNYGIGTSYTSMALGFPSTIEIT